MRRLVPPWSFLTRLRRPLLFRLAGKEGGEKGRWVTVWCFLPLILGENQCFRRRSTRWSPYGFFDYAPPDTGMSSLQLVALERLPSIEGAGEILIDVTFLRGKAPLSGADSPYQGEMSRRDKRGRDAVTEGD